MFYAKTAHNFYNMSKGFYRAHAGGRLTRKKKLEMLRSQKQMNKSLNILHAYGEYNGFVKYQ